MDRAGVDSVTVKGTVREIKEWRAIMNQFRGLPVKNAGDNNDPRR